MNLRSYPLEGGGFVVTDPDRLPTCTLIKMQTDDGFFQFNPATAYVGKKYKFAPHSRRVAMMLNEPTGITREREVVLVYDERGHFGVMPVECLELPSPLKVGPTHQTPERRCPKCGKQVDAVTEVGHDRDQEPPKEGDITICGYCHAVLTFAERMTLRSLTPGEMDALSADLRQILEGAREAMKRISAQRNKRP